VFIPCDGWCTGWSQCDGGHDHVAEWHRRICLMALDRRLTVYSSKIIDDARAVFPASLSAPSSSRGARSSGLLRAGPRRQARTGVPFSQDCETNASTGQVTKIVNRQPMCAAGIVMGALRIEFRL